MCVVAYIADEVLPGEGLLLHDSSGPTNTIQSEKKVILEEL